MTAYNDARAAIRAALVSGPNQIHPETVAELMVALTDTVINDLVDAISGGTSIASIDSPNFIGTPTAPTASAGTNTTQLATTAFVKAAINALINAAPGTLDTLGEIAAALAADESVVAALTSTVAGKQPLDQDLTDIAGLSRAKGSLIVGGASAWLALAIGANGTIPYADSTQASGIRWDTAPSGGGSTPANVTYNTGGVIVQFTAANATDIPLVVKGAASQSANLAEWRNSAGTAVAYMTAGGTGFFQKVYAQNQSIALGENSSGEITVRSSGGYGWSSGSNGLSAPDTRLDRNAAGVVEINNGTVGTYRDLVARHLTVTGSLGSADVRALEIAVSELKGDRINMPSGIVDPFADASDIATLTNADTSASGKITPTVGTATFVSGSAYFGDMTSGNGLAGAYDSNTSTYSLNGTQATTAYNGIQLATGKRVKQAVVTPATTGLCGGGSTSNAFRLYGKNSAPANATDGTLLGSVTGLSNSVTAAQTINSNDTTTSYSYVWIAIVGSGSENFAISEIVFTETTGSNNLTLISAAFTAASAPSLVRLGIQIKPIDAITINTDVIASVSRDGGTTWTAATLALELAREDGTSIYVHDGLNISGQPSGTSMKWKIVTANNKSVEIHGIDEFKWR